MIFTVILYPVKFTVELWIENEDMTSIFDDFLQAGVGALGVLWRLKCSCTAFTSQKTLRARDVLGSLVRIWVVFGIKDQGLVRLGQ